MARPRMSDIDREIGKRVRIARNERRLSQTAVAQALGLTFQQVQKYENGANRIAAGRLVAIAALLGKDFGWFARGLAEAQPAPEGVQIDLLHRLALTGPRGVALVDAFVGFDSRMQAMAVDLLQELARLRAEAAAGEHGRKAAA